jgi:hypothetical protein
MLRYEMAGLKLGIIHNRGNKFGRLKPFKSVFASDPDIEIRFQPSLSFIVPDYDINRNDWVSWHTEYDNDNDNDKTIVYVYIQAAARTEYVIEAKHDWSDITIRYLKGNKWVEETFCFYLGNFIFSNIAICNGGFVLHASSVSYSGRGIAFTAPSGTGKSTHASMWEKYYNAKILNDDCPVIKCKGNQPFIYGSPWSGSSNKAMPSSSPLSALVILEQSGQNSIRELTNEEAIPLILPRIFLPYQNPSLMDMALHNVERAIKDVPKYLLKCRPDKEATELVYQCIK